MINRWYICPYDIEKRKNSLTRHCAMYRYVPLVPNSDGSNWSEVEILGSHTLVKVSAIDNVHDKMELDVDFLEIPNPISVSSQVAISNKLLSLGYSQQQLDSVGFDFSNLLDLISAHRNKVKVNAEKDGIDILSEERPPGKTIANINEEIP